MQGHTHTKKERQRHTHTESVSQREKGELTVCIEKRIKAGLRC